MNTLKWRINKGPAGSAIIKSINIITILHQPVLRPCSNQLPSLDGIMAPSILHYDIFVCSVVAVSMYRLDEEIELDFVFLFFMTRFCVGEFF